MEFPVQDPSLNTPAQTTPVTKNQRNFLALGVVLGATLIMIAVIYLGGRPASPTNTPAATNSATISNEVTFDFSNPVRSAHHESNVPAHGAVLAAAPVNIVLDFNFDLHPTKNTIQVLDEFNTDFGVGGMIVDASKLSMRRNVDPNIPDGIYTVRYSACWPDATCHEGSFQFAIDRSKAVGYTDMRGKTEVTVDLKQIAFSPMDLRISKGTKITWVNGDTEGHYINTDSHPHHTYHKAQNSTLLATGQTFSLTFDKAGIYPYHCSAHTQMTGSIIVD